MRVYCHCRQLQTTAKFYLKWLWLLLFRIRFKCYFPCTQRYCCCCCCCDRFCCCYRCWCHICCCCCCCCSCCCNCCCCGVNYRSLINIYNNNDIMIIPKKNFYEENDHKQFLKNKFNSIRFQWAGC